MLTFPAILESMLFASGEPMEKKQLMTLLDVSDVKLAQTIEELYASLTGGGLTLIETEHCVELRTAPEAAEFVKKLREGELSRDLGKAGLEVLSIILYRGSATRGEIDWVRGVNSSATIRSLLMRGLINGKEDTTDRRRLRYRTTHDALAHLGISHIEDLPQYEALSRALKETQQEVSVSNTL